VKTLVIGATGLVGAHVARTMAGLGPVAATGFSRSANGTVPLDVRDEAAVRRVVSAARPDVVVCAAAEPHVDLCEREPRQTRAINVDGFRHVATAAAAAGATLVYFSSDYVFDGRLGDYREDAVMCPINEYGRQKVEAETIAQQVPKWIVLRISGVFGVDDRRKNFVYQVVDRLRAGAPVLAADDQTLCPTWAPALADALAVLLRGGFRGICNVVGPEPTVRVDFARRIGLAFGLNTAPVRAVHSNELTGAAPRPARSSLSDGLLRSLVGHGLPALDVALADMRNAGI
jgi:dTDP-4-dehydrorhamnose reductase